MICWDTRRQNFESGTGMMRENGMEPFWKMTRSGIMIKRCRAIMKRLQPYPAL